jgi:FkbM family methyltransferase
MTRYGVKPRGAIHVGAHLGEEYENYKNIGVPRIMMVEANPNIYRDLEKKLGNVENVILVNRAISDANERRPFHIMNASQSSSLLALKRHSEIYPQIIERGEINVICSRLDDLLEELGETPGAYNILNIDVQGAEMMVLHGANEVLKAMEVIYLEVNFDEMYSGCSQIEEVDEFLRGRGFSRVALACPYHPSWGDAVYVRNKIS